eukprot:CAMPEP_0178576056 /NCGR_PEP_ID=MMETSP0697-20121206/20241_1 /TAXON_ID=265572 /ORGANISM="Extubocellulus spinifer, Strain CCMP396" /LENGTH=45 /DNA_ID= /DNA_START= /DNA_END= /DNA_ORIENTATION=
MSDNDDDDDDNGREEGTTSLGVPTNADAVPSRAASPVPPSGGGAA